MFGQVLTQHSVDDDTAAMMQEVIDSDFKNTTVLAIMHRLDHIEKYDKVLLLEQGELMEFDDPRKLSSQTSRLAELQKGRPE